MTNSLNSPIEVLEQTFPFRILQYELQPESAGAGQWRGGYGMCKRLQLDAPATVTVAFARVESQPWGLEGGTNGSSARLSLTRRGKTEPLPGRGTFDFEAGDILTIVSPGGGGYGPSQEREPSSITRDVEAELLSAEAAARIYGWHRHPAVGDGRKARASTEGARSGARADGGLAREGELRQARPRKHEER